MVEGKHTIRFGVDFQRIRVQTLQPPTGRGSYRYTGAFTQIPGHSSNSGFDVADLIQDQMQSASITSTVTVHNQRWYRAGYVEDDWRALPKLTWNLGLRYEYFQPLEELNDNQANFVANWSNKTATFYLANSKKALALPAPLLADFAANKVTVVYTGNRTFIDTQKDDFSPRVGFAYQVNSGLVALFLRLEGGGNMFACCITDAESTSCTYLCNCRLNGEGPIAVPALDPKIGRIYGTTKMFLDRCI
jgi:outer membrane receptor protein involved in Fe transport